jgi:citrate lyase subunit beta/citryl-CoA lyase
MAPRTYLFVPGDGEQKLAKAVTRGADAVIADLEDAVTADGKARARATVARWLHNRTKPHVERWVRVNPGSMLAADVAALAGTTISGIFLPKVAGRRDVETARAALDAAGQRSAAVIPLIETASALARVHDIAEAPRVRQLMIGEMDLGADLGMAPASSAWTAVRVQLVIASSAAGLPPPIGPVDPDFRDLDRLRRETRRLYEMGYGSRAAIHPAQIPVFREALTPDAADTARAREVVEMYDRAVEAGRGVAVDADGRMLDEAVVRWARRILDLADDNER